MLPVIRASRPLQRLLTCTPAGEESSYPADAVVFAVGITGMQKLVPAVDLLSCRPEFRAIMNLRSIDVIATRLWCGDEASTEIPWGEGCHGRLPRS